MLTVTKIAKGTKNMSKIMAKNIHESHKKCVICGKEFVTNMDWKLTCSQKCSKKLSRQRQIESSALYKPKTPKERELAENAVKIKKAVTEAAHRRRMQRQREARELGLSYAQYIAQKGIKEI